MAGINRTTILKGPALIQFGGQNFWSKGDVSVTFSPKLFAIATAAFGDVDERVSDRTVDVSFVPSGAFTAATIAVLWPYAATAMGASIYGGTDRALTVWSRDGKKLVVPNAAVTGMPTINLGVSKTIHGPVKFTGLLANNSDPSTAGAYFTLSTQAYPGDAGFAVSDIKTQAYASAWGAAPWDAFYTETGWEISFGMRLVPDPVDSLGTVDFTLQGLTVSAKAIPVGPSETDILSKLLPASALGNSIAAAAAPLNISASGVYVRVYNAGIVDSAFVYGAEKKRLGTTEWRATRTVTTGTADPLFYVGTAAPA